MDVTKERIEDPDILTNEDTLTPDTDVSTSIEAGPGALLKARFRVVRGIGAVPGVDIVFVTSGDALFLVPGSPTNKARTIKNQTDDEGWTPYVFFTCATPESVTITASEILDPSVTNSQVFQFISGDYHLKLHPIGQGPADGKTSLKAIAEVTDGTALAPGVEVQFKITPDTLQACFSNGLQCITIATDEHGVATALFTSSNIEQGKVTGSLPADLQVEDEPSQTFSFISPYNLNLEPMAEAVAANGISNQFAVAAVTKYDGGVPSPEVNVVFTLTGYATFDGKSQQTAIITTVNGIARASFTDLLAEEGSVSAYVQGDKLGTSATQKYWFRIPAVLVLSPVATQYSGDDVSVPVTAQLMLAKQPQPKKEIKFATTGGATVSPILNAPFGITNSNGQASVTLAFKKHNYGVVTATSVDYPEATNSQKYPFMDSFTYNFSVKGVVHGSYTVDLVNWQVKVTATLDELAHNAFTEEARGIYGSQIEIRFRGKELVVKKGYVSNCYTADFRFSKENSATFRDNGRTITTIITQRVSEGFPIPTGPMRYDGTFEYQKLGLTIWSDPGLGDPPATGATYTNSNPEEPGIPYPGGSTVRFTPPLVLSDPFSPSR